MTLFAARDVLYIQNIIHFQKEDMYEKAKETAWKPAAGILPRSNDDADDGVRGGDKLTAGR